MVTVGSLDVTGTQRRLTSSPMNVNGAQHAIAQGMPQSATKNVANPADPVSGANTIVPANTMCEIIQAVPRSGYERCILLKYRPIVNVIVGLKELFRLSVEQTKGNRMDANKATKEKNTRAKLPNRLKSVGTSCDLGISDLEAS
ncbi:hypothetical protein TESG_06074 [Trichophyton tonsurans CBS 112818]|uniref:Uncharacterized protein n=1 Tax=Trichophyton tonsurans (strain CBS 112818) TaxID=647933 RepID=F2S5F2_TRIT1|nr:hypothetical protein TESG_06074 [Trichophyton tonsurans CBS 112818]